MTKPRRLHSYIEPLVETVVEERRVGSSTSRSSGYTSWSSAR
jgi:hypothetical protein